MGFRLSFLRIFAVAIVLAASAISVLAQPTGLSRQADRNVGDKSKSAVDAKKVDLSEPFLVEMRGIVDRKGIIDFSSSTFIRTEGDPALIDAVKSGILAVSEAGYFSYFKPPASDGFLLIIEQSASDFKARLSTEFSTVNHANAIRSMAQLVATTARHANQEPNAAGADRRDLVLLSGLAVQSEGKSMITSIKVPAEQFQKLLADHLAEQSKNGR